LVLDCYPYPQPSLSVLATLRLGVRIIFEAVDNTRDAVFDERHLKVDEQSQSLVGEAKIRQQLFLVTGASNSTDFTSTITLSSTIMSARNPASIRTFS